MGLYKERLFCITVKVRGSCMENDGNNTSSEVSVLTMTKHSL